MRPKYMLLSLFLMVRNLPSKGEDDENSKCVNFYTFNFNSVNRRRDT